MPVEIEEGLSGLAVLRVPEPAAIAQQQRPLLGSIADFHAGDHIDTFGTRARQPGGRSRPDRLPGWTGRSARAARRCGAVPPPALRREPGVCVRIATGRSGYRVAPFPPTCVFATVFLTLAVTGFERPE